ncbi:MAG: ATP-binding cassette domain-containing protein [Proteobacteria bacterium]|nr:ATP-binding cassette domain-containing protein [Pseudomonadota bacterium]
MVRFVGQDVPPRGTRGGRMLRGTFSTRRPLGPVTRPPRSGRPLASESDRPSPLRSTSMFERRMLVVGAVLVVAMGTMATRLFSLTVVSGSEQRALAQSRLDRSSLLPTVRGAITDRKGRVLAESVPSYDLAVFYPAINGTWASTRAIAAAKKEAGRAAWNKLGPADREERIAAQHRALQAELDAVIAEATAATGLPAAEFAARMGEVRTQVEKKANAVWEARLEIEEKQASTRQKALARELEWINKSPQGRMAKSKSRVERYEQLVSQNQKEKAAEVEIFIPPGPRLGTLVVEAKGVSKAYGDKLLLDDVSFSIPAGAIVGIIGPNGAGKTTLFRMIIGAEKPDSGELRVGESVKLAYVEQSRETLPNDKNLWEAISDGGEKMLLGGVEVNSRAYVARFGFTGTDQSKIVGNLSGGERNRVHLARMLKQCANVILLDEPTNDLDVNTMRALEEGMENFVGCSVVISHDRWFLDRVATHILAFEGDSKVFFFDGNYSAYEADRRRRLGIPADAAPRRIQYRALTR